MSLHHNTLKTSSSSSRQADPAKKKMSGARPRQEPGLACQECRRKKLRCDRRVPCGGCVDAGVQCQVNPDRPTRGPKRGHLKELRSRIAILESRLGEPDDDLGGVLGLNLDLDEQDLPVITEIDLDSQMLNSAAEPFPMPVMAPDSSIESAALFGLDTASGAIPRVTQADLNQLYFDRVHDFVPMLQQGRYFSWAKSQCPSRSHMCLQYAAWTMAASLSSHFQSMRDLLYQDTRQMLETLEREDRREEESFYLQQAQAWTLVAIYEFMQKSFQRTWASTGRALRLIQLMKLNEIDAVEPVHDVSRLSDATETEREEKRRTFWMGYCLDRFFSVLNGLSITVNEDTISTRLPSSKSEFQSGSPVAGPFLSDAIGATDWTLCNPFSEFIIFSTIWGRILGHQQQASVERVSGSPTAEFWDRHRWLEGLLMQRIQLHQGYSQSVWMDPMLLFTKMIAQVSVLSLGKATNLVVWQAHDSRDMLAQTEQKSSTAAQEIGRLSQYLSRVSFLKIHPFTSIPLLLGGEFLIHNKGQDATFDSNFLEITQTLRELKDVNLLCQAPLSLFDSTTSAKLLNWETQHLDVVESLL